MIKRIINLKPVVEDLLRNYPETRDDDRILILKVWAFQNGELRNPEVPFVEFASDFLHGRYYDFESIRRTRQLIQSRNPVLRGRTHYNRMAEAAQMRNQLKIKL